MKRDYSKPIRDECRNCGAPSKEMRAGAPVWCVSPTCGVGFIPVYAVIPEDERPATHKPRAHDVVVDGYALDITMRVTKRYALGCAKALDRDKGDWWLLCGADDLPQVNALADAVLWVAEGKRP